MKTIKLDIKLLSTEYMVRRLTEEDIVDIYDLCIGNSLYYKYCPPLVSSESIMSDMQALPPDVDIADKYYAGFYSEEKLIAVIDLISGYPEKTVAYIGFFMTDIFIQRAGIGTKIINHLCKYLKTVGFEYLQLAWVKGNPQAEHFWIKSGLIKIKETLSTTDASVILARKLL